jgi:DNA-binding transcriptional MocR family regulator
MRININREKKVPLYLQIQKQIEAAIISGKLPAGFVLPSERRLAEDIGVNRNTTIKAYEKLKDDGLLDSKIGKGTYVIYEKHAVPEIEGAGQLYWDQMGGNYSFRNSAMIMTKIMSAVQTKNSIPLSGGFPSKEHFPQKQFEIIAAEVLSKRNDSLFQTPVQGDQKLLKTLRDYLYRGKSIVSQQDEVIVTSGSQQGLNLIIDTYIRPGDRVIMENPSFFGAIHLFKKAGAQIITTDIRGGKLDLNHIEYNLKRTPVKFIYLVPNFQNPTGYLMDMDTRKQLLYLSKKYGVPIIEEDPYGQLYYESYTPTLKSMDRENYVIYIGTFSKTISPGFRVGYIVADHQVINRLIMLKQFVDIHANSISQLMIESFISKGLYEEHLEKMRQLYKTKRDYMMERLDEMSGMLDYERPKGGYYFWCQLLEGLSVNELHEMGRKEGFDFIPGEFFYSNAIEGTDFMRLNFTYSTIEQIAQGMDRMIHSLNKMMR